MSMEGTLDPSASASADELERTEAALERTERTQGLAPDASATQGLGYDATVELSADAGSSMTQTLLGPARGESPAPAAALPEEPPRRATKVRRGQVAEPGAVIGRYVVLARLGAGAMGVVFAAYDPELDRKLALKLLRPQRGRRGVESSAQRRLQREAQALAKLGHPNVVAVHDVGFEQGQLFIAMEFVEGQTLGEWVEQHERSWREILAHFLAAGEGLAAAHAVDLVHRDFKPDNVMIGVDGRVRVMDFGLARTRSQLESSEELPNIEELARALAESGEGLERLTRTGAVVGTPAYMSAEQFAGKLADARSDQFSFCASLYKCLYGQRAFAGATLEALHRRVEAGEITSVPGDTEVPSWLHKVLVRGLAPDPAARFPSMRALLDALADDPRAKWRRAGVAAVVVASIGAAVFGLSRSPVEAPTQTCTGTPERVAEVWSEARRDALQRTFEATGLSYAGDSAQRVSALLEDHGRTWVAARVEACEATQRGDQSARLLDLRMACLDERLWEFDALLEVFDRADADVVVHAVQAVASLPKISQCADPRRLEAELPPPSDPVVAASVAELERRMARTQALYDAAQYEQGAKLADALLAEAVALDYGPLSAELRLRAGSFALRRGDYERAREQLEQAYRTALGLRMHELAATAAADLVWVLGERLALHEEGQAWTLHAEALVEAAGSDALRGRYLVNLGNLAWAQAKYERAGEYYGEVLALRERDEGVDALALASPLLNLGNVAWALGKYEEAEAYYLRSSSIQEAELGPRHPDLATSFNNLGGLAGTRGDYEAAVGYQRRAIESWVESLGAKHVRVSDARYNLAQSLISLERFEEAEAEAQQTLELRRELLGEAHPDTGASLAMLADLAQKRGDYTRARELCMQALRVREQALGKEHPGLAFQYGLLGMIGEGEGDLEAARRAYQRTVELREKGLGEDHVLLRFPLRRLGALALDGGEYALASELLERSLKISLASEDNPLVHAEMRFALAQALRGVGGPKARSRATQLIEQVRAWEANAGDGPDATTLREQLREWEE